MMEDERRQFVVYQTTKGRRIERAKLRAWSPADAVARLKQALGKVAEAWDLTAEEVS